MNRLHLPVEPDRHPVGSTPRPNRRRTLFLDVVALVERQRRLDAGEPIAQLVHDDDRKAA